MASSCSSGAVVTIGMVTALLNLDTSVAFLTPVLIYTARSRGEGEAPLLYGCLLLSNAGSLFLPGSNLTNLIVLGHLHLTGGAVLRAHVARRTRRAVRDRCADRDRRTTVAARHSGRPHQTPRPVIGVGLVAVGIATRSSCCCPSPGAVRRRGRRRGDRHSIWSTPRSAVARGLRPRHPRSSPASSASQSCSAPWAARGRGPRRLLSHLDQWGTAAVGAVASFLFNNLPAASLLAAQPPAHPFAALDRPEPRPQPLRDRLPRLDPLASCGAERRRGAVRHQSRAR